MNRYTAALVFLSGVLVAAAGILLADFFREYNWGQQRRQSFQTLLPDSASLLVVEDPPGFHPFSPPPSPEGSPPAAADHTSLQRKPSTDLLNYKDCESEVLKVIKAAVGSGGGAAAAGDYRRVKKAKKLFDHAIDMCPKHPLVLVLYGEFLEKSEGDVVAADHLYTRAMAFSASDSEEHARALQNKRRMASQVEELDMRVLRRIDSKKEAFQLASLNNPAMRRVKKEAYFLHIFHTVGIEGNTMTLSQTRSVLETKLAVSGKSIMEHNEVLGLDLALKYINQTMVDKAGLVTQDDVMEIHRRVLGMVDPLEAGTVRQTQVYIGNHVPPHPSDVDLLLQKFLVWLNHPDVLNLHPIRLAALAHYKLVHIHPFADGNGRTSRLLMNLLLMQSGFPPVIIRKQDRHPYFGRLGTANEGDIRPFVRFIAECAERTLDAYIASAAEGPAGAGTAGGHFAGLAPFADEAETTIAAPDHLEYHSAVIMGGKVGDNVTVVEP